MTATEQQETRVVVFIDYQNTMNAARLAFCHRPYGASDGQIDPKRYANLLVARTPLGTSGRRVLKEVRVYRGRPDPRKEGRTYAAHMRQCDAWERQGSKVITRPLRYPRDWPKEKAEEKGIDVQMAIDAVVQAINRELDVAIIVSTDTDLRPALEAFHILPLDPPAVIETAAWRSPHYSQKLQASGLHVWCHLVEEDDFRSVRDLRDYNIPK
jgi:uncharacterized LabA/DUF88 family protein